MLFSEVDYRYEPNSRSVTCTRFYLDYDSDHIGHLCTPCSASSLCLPPSTNDNEVLFQKSISIGDFIYDLTHCITSTPS